MMRLRAGLLIFWLQWALAATADDPSSGSVAVYQGLVQALAYGDMVACDGPVLRTRLTYLSMQGVCDDLGERPCVGRLVAEIERCVQNSVALEAGGLVGGYSRSVVRFCFEPEPPVAGATVACADHNRIGVGSWVGAGRAAQGDSVLEATAVLRLQRVRAFLIDGQWRRLPRANQTQHFTQQRSFPGPGSCALPPQPGCGVIGVGLE